MLSFSHSLTGSFIAAKLPHPLLYIPLTLAAHYLQDWIPHWDVGTGLSNGQRKKSTALILEVIDLIFTVALIYWFFGQAPFPQNIHIWVGALTGIAPDLAESPRNFLHWEPTILKPLNRFHHFFHRSTTNLVLGLLPQILLVGVIYFLK